MYSVIERHRNEQKDGETETGTPEDKRSDGARERGRQTETERKRESAVEELHIEPIA